MENRNLAPGTRLVATCKKQRYVCTVEAADDGEGVAFVFEDGKRYKSPSAAAVAITKVAQNGWRFWSLESAAPAANSEAAPSEKPAKGKTKNRKLIYKLPNQQGTPQGQTKFFCTACMKSFVAESTETPDACPEGHRKDDTELTGEVGAAEAEVVA